MFAGLSAKRQDENLRLTRELAELRASVAQVNQKLAAISVPAAIIQPSPASWKNTAATLDFGGPGRGAFTVLCSPNPVSEEILSFGSPPVHWSGLPSPPDFELVRPPFSWNPILQPKGMVVDSPKAGPTEFH